MTNSVLPATIIESELPIECRYLDNTVISIELVNQGQSILFQGIHLQFNVDETLLKAGAINNTSAVTLFEQIDALNNNLNNISKKDAVIFRINSAGADFASPNEALSNIEQWLTTLSDIKRTTDSERQWIAVVPHYLYGGMAISICTLFDTVILEPNARLGVLGSTKLYKK